MLPSVNMERCLKGMTSVLFYKEMKHTPVPDDVVYVPSVEELEALDVAKALQNKGFGGIPIEIGYCNGHNKKLNAVEYHRSSEINVAVTGSGSAYRKPAGYHR